MKTKPEMANQAVGDSQTCYEVNSFIRGLHVYQTIWTPVTGEVLLLKREPDNIHDKYAVVVVRQSDRTTVGHIPYNLAPIVSPFLVRDFNKAVAEVTSPGLNRGAGYGMEVPCIYRLYGQQRYVDRAKESIQKLLNDCLL